MPTLEVILLALLHLTPATLGVYHILLYKRDPRAAMGWIIICIFIPYGGPVGYYLFGINRVRSRARAFKRSFLAIEYEAGERRYAGLSLADTGMHTVGERITGKRLTEGNLVEAIHNGDSVYPAMIESINNAADHVLLATYIFQTDGTGSIFADALEEAVSRGVDVKVLIDGVGELYSRRRPSKMLRKRGIEAARFLPPRLMPPSIYMNLRNHRKLLVIDQEVAYAGGMNIGDENVDAPNRPRKVTDLHFRLQGPIVRSLAGIFHSDWRFTTGVDTTHLEPELTEHSRNARCRVIPDGPDHEMDTLALIMQSVISCATKRVDIMTPYFLPSREMIASLQSAALKGVTVRVILPAKSNLFYVHWANRNTLAELLKSGIQAYYQPAPFCHSKLLCIDHEYSLIGSANVDPRSLRLNFELGVEVFCKKLNADLRKHIEDVIAVSAQISLHDLTNRSVPTRLRDSFTALFTPYL